MSVDWTPHRFAGGVLALDVANTVVLRGDARGFDRFSDVAELPRFAAAASAQRHAELCGRTLGVADPAASASLVIALREATDRLFRRAAVAGALETADLSAFLSCCAAATGRDGETLLAADHPFGRGPAPLALETATAISALSLLQRESLRRIRICGHCGWLFVDRSRNASRVWCDMAVCGNRRKARAHYDRNRRMRYAGN
jgi:predicted RNA-binding Zn ribbon-like protein